MGNEAGGSVFLRIVHPLYAVMVSDAPGGVLQSVAVLVQVLSGVLIPGILLQLMLGSPIQTAVNTHTTY